MLRISGLPRCSHFLGQAVHCRAEGYVNVDKAKHSFLELSDCRVQTECRTIRLHPDTSHVQFFKTLGIQNIP